MSDKKQPPPPPDTTPGSAPEPFQKSYIEDDLIELNESRLPPAIYVRDTQPPPADPPPGDAGSDEGG